MKLSPPKIIRSHMLSSVAVTYPLGLWKQMQILVDICDARRIQPPDTLTIKRDAKPGVLLLSLSRDGYLVSAAGEDDTDTVDAPIFRSVCHAIIDAYESRAEGEPRAFR